ncbi:hypothetical protein [Mycolicibacterium mucogenicum]|uniref:Uncharacterized protein n=1 Tax=Mycolicibacterium mucogenicum TaxID=56689 RepID=A0A4R5WDG1_MYCMU|nr:hypothetical protein [Mycolicibacterium mucogenicum]TDK87886.1 hypothetical protein EUA03_16185 [Mycolicibacterium mucogenicum]
MGVGTGAGAGAEVEVAVVEAGEVAAGADVVELAGVAGVSGAGGGISNPASDPIPSRSNKMTTAPTTTISTLPPSVLNHFVGADAV